MIGTVSPDPARADVSLDCLQYLLDQGAESVHLDFKQTIDLSNKDDVVNLARHVGAFSDYGGWIVIGADNEGNVCGFTGDPSDWDESRLRSRLRKYLSPGFRIISAVHHLNNKTVVLLHILPHPDGANIFFADGVAKDTVYFRQGDVFTRHGTSSERIQQSDMARILDKRAIVAEQKELAARNARTATFGPLENSGLNQPHRYLWARIGWATSERPSDLTARMFYPLKRSNEFSSFYAMCFEQKFIRRDGHSYDCDLEVMSDSIRTHGVISCSGEADTYIDSHVTADGCISIAITEEVTDWTPDEVFGWWVFGACEIAHEILTMLELRGTLFSCYRLLLPGPPWSSNDAGLEIKEFTTTSQVSYPLSISYLEFAAQEVQNILQQKNSFDGEWSPGPAFDILTAHQSMIHRRTAWHSTPARLRHKGLYRRGVGY